MEKELEAPLRQAIGVLEQHGYRYAIIRFKITEYLASSTSPDHQPKTPMFNHTATR